MNNVFSITKIISGLSKTLNIVNQLIPLYNQVKPYMGKANNFINNINNINNINTINTTNNNKYLKNTIEPDKSTHQNNLPTFFQ